MPCTKESVLIAFFLNKKNQTGNLNKFVKAPQFKLEDYRSVLKLLNKNCFVTKVDLKDAYFSVPVHKEHRK
ncbi:hypothetical protein NQ315_016731 [Exocentrus adspersus]|uniref:Reverse transcriptase domain-containing protein n=1 Tax=Exocentrus adspersus TaxID=1586481 RepID=A0AAV8VFG4_9CUCU|nr:hypothetical protein NQ315_016731 [Exocentrus adspersus]